MKFASYWPYRMLLVMVAIATLGASTPVAADEDSKVLIAAGRSVLGEAAGYGYRHWIRESVRSEVDESQFGLQFDENWQSVAEKSPQLPLVVLVHGFNSTPLRNAAVLVPVKAAGYPCATFAYPNDCDIRKSSDLLSRELKAIAQRYPQLKVALVTHSMGGLVARACVENPQLDPGNVTRLLMIAPPSQGTLLAHLAIATDVWEHWISRPDGDFGTRWQDSVVDGLGEAANDLVPGSPFLVELNARLRNPRIRYTLLLGTGATVDEGEMKWARSALLKTSSRWPRLHSSTGQFDELLADMEEVIDGKGDGVVAVKRGRLDGVDDVVILPFGHLSCTGAPDSEAVKQVQHELLSRLR